MKHLRILIPALVVAVCLVSGSWVIVRPVRADNEGRELPAGPGQAGRFHLLPQAKDAAVDDMQMLDTATGRLYGLHRREKVKDKEQYYEWVLLADAPK